MKIDSPVQLGDEQLRALGEAIGSDPMSGVAILTEEGRVLWANAQISRMYRGEDALPSESVGRKITELFPENWANERIAISRRCAENGKPVLLRSIWKGEQILTWMRPIDTQSNDHRNGDAAPRRLLAISRKHAGGTSGGFARGEDFDRIDSGVIDLGPLDVLSTRELEVLALLGQGLSAAEIAQVLHRSVKTINTHRESIGKKLRIDDRVKLAEIAHRAGLRMEDAERKRT
jgi:DNA-binding CsgD family transcriptional regulator